MVIPPSHFSVQKLWKEKFFDDSILKYSKAIAFLLEDGEILKSLQQSNQKENIKFFYDYKEALNWIQNYNE